MICEHVGVATKVSTWLERYRAEHGLGYRELADKLGVSLSQAHDWATGKYDPTLKNIRRIARRLKVSTAELVA